MQHSLAPAHSRLKLRDTDKIPDSAACTGFDTYPWPAVPQGKTRDTEMLRDLIRMLISKDCFGIAVLSNVPVEIDGNGPPAPGAAKRLKATLARDAVIHRGARLVRFYNDASKHPAPPNATSSSRWPISSQETSKLAPSVRSNG